MIDDLPDRTAVGRRLPSGVNGAEFVERLDYKRVVAVKSLEGPETVSAEDVSP
jgi:hypothetical protein